MNITLPILLLVFGSLTFWLLNESSLKWYYKTMCISVFCIFTIIFWSAISTFLGWPAKAEDMPEKILIHWIVIKEPNKFTKFNGAIYILAESAEKDDSSKFIRFFSYKKNKGEPRQFGLPYSRKLHEHFQKSVIPKLKKGQPVAGKLTKKAGEQRSGKGKTKPQNDKGGGSESQEQEWMFHELLPSEIHKKPE